MTTLIAQVFGGVWNYFYKDIFYGNDLAFFIGAQVVTTLIWFWGTASILAVVDMTGKPSFMLKYRVQDGNTEPIPADKVLHAFKVVAVNLFVINVSAMVLLYPLQQYMGCSCRSDDLPSLWIFARDFICCALADEVVFYYTHRLAHTGWLYRNVHKIHHEWTSPIGITAEYCHPIEHILCNVPSFMSGPLLMGSHLFTTVIWYGVVFHTTVIHHSGYHLPFMSSPEFHDYHHLTFNWNFGGNLFLDRLHGTDEQWLKSKQIKRDFTSYSLTPVKEQVPFNED